MPKFDIPRQQVSLNPAQADAQAFGAGTAQALGQVGTALSQSAKIIQEKRDRDELFQIENDLTNHMVELDDLQDSLSKEYPDGKGLVDAYDVKSREMQQSFLENVPERHRSRAQVKLNKLRANSLVSARNMQSSLVGIKFESDTRASVDSLANLARKTGDSSGSIERLRESTEVLKQYNPKAAAQILENGTDAILAERLKHDLENFGYQEVKKDWESGVYSDLTPGVAERLMGQIKSQAAVDVNDDIRQATSDFSKGFQTQADLRGSLEVARMAGLDDQAKELETLIKVEPQVYEFGRARGSVQSGVLGEMVDKALDIGLNDEEQILFASYTNIISMKERMVKDDPLGYYSKIDVIPEPNQIRFIPGANGLDVDSIVSGINERKLYRESIIRHDNVKVPLITESEVNEILSVIDGSSPKDKATYMHHLTRALYASDPELLKSVPLMMGKKDKDLPGLMALSMSNPELVSKIFAGRDAPATLPSKDKWETAFDSLNLRISGLPASTQESIMRHSKSLYSYYVSVGQEKEVKDVIEEVSGKPFKLHNGTYSTSFYTLDGKKIEDDKLSLALKEMNDDEIIAAAGGLPTFAGKTMHAEEIREHLQVSPISMNEFKLNRKGSQDYFAIDGDPATFNAEKLIGLVNARYQKEVSQRRRKQVSARTGRDR